MKTYINFHRVTPFDQDAEWFRIIRHHVDEDGQCTSETLGADGEWHEFEPYEVLPPFCAIPGSEVAEALGTGMRARGWVKTWEVTADD